MTREGAIHFIQFYGLKDLGYSYSKEMIPFIKAFSEGKRIFYNNDELINPMFDGSPKNYKIVEVENKISRHFGDPKNFGM